MRPTHLVAIAIAAYLLFLVTRIPAQFAYVFMQDRLPNLTLGELEGTVWQGTARSVVYNGIYAGSLEWNVRPLRVLLGEWNAAIQLRGPVESNADIGYSLADILTIENASVKARLANLGQFLPQLSIMVTEGELSAIIESLELQGESLLVIRGSATIDNLFAGGLQLGDFAAEMSTDDDGTRKLAFTSVGSDGLDVQGELSLNQQEQVTLDLLVKNPEHLGDLAGLFRRFSSEEPDGNRFRWSGESSDLKKYL
ncbi:MAG: type II secretion system protein N [Gammaproteobacteria bacterium]|jgi:hypothetical protein